MKSEKLRKKKLRLKSNRTYLCSLVKVVASRKKKLRLKEKGRSAGAYRVLEFLPFF